MLPQHILVQIIDCVFSFYSIDGEWVPKEGDEVSYKLCAIPPKMEKFSAVHVKITHQSPGSHEKWDDPFPKQGEPDQ